MPMSWTKLENSPTGGYSAIFAFNHNFIVINGNNIFVYYPYLDSKYPNSKPQQNSSCYKILKQYNIFVIACTKRCTIILFSSKMKLMKYFV